MTHQHLENSQENAMAHCQDCDKSINYAAYVIGASVLVGCILISATIFYNFKELIKSQNTAAPSMVQIQGNQVGQGAPTAPTAAAGQNGGVVDIKLNSNVPYLGSGSAKVTVVEYADYQCPFCERFFNTVMPEIKSKYIDTGKIKFVYQDFAFLGPDSTSASEAAHCAADQGKFWQYHDYLFKNQGQENSGWASAENQKKIAANLGLNTSQFNQCLDGKKYEAQVNAETAAGKSYGVSGTPTVFVNGKAIVGAQPAASFTQAIDAALAGK